jgi:hypothetical protein
MYVLVWLHVAQRNVCLAMCVAIGWGVTAARTMVVAHFGHGAVVSDVTVAAAVMVVAWIIGPTSHAD